MLLPDFKTSTCMNIMLHAPIKFHLYIEFEKSELIVPIPVKFTKCLIYFLVYKMNLISVTQKVARANSI